MIQTKEIFSSYSVNDLEQSQHFYQNILGLRTELTSMGLNLYLSDNHAVFLYAKEAQHQPASFTVLNLVVADIRESVKFLTEKGIAMDHYEGMAQDTSGIMWSEEGPSIAWFKDPSDNVISFIQNTTE